MRPERLRTLLSALLLSANALLFASAAGAVDSFGGSLTVTTDYVNRGLSQTRGKAAAQGGMHAQFASGWVTGAWASTVDLNPGRGATVEIDVYAARYWTLGEHWSARLGATHYIYPNDNPTLPYDYDELSASLSFQSRLTATVSWSPNTSKFGLGRRVKYREAIAYELAGLQPIGTAWSVVGGLGYYDLADLFDAGYWYWNAGLAYTIGAIQLDLSRIDTDSRAARLFGNTITDARWSASILWRF